MKPRLSVVTSEPRNSVTAQARGEAMRRWLRVGGHLAGNTSKGVFKAARYVAFYVLMWLRILVHFVTNGCAALGLLGFVLGAIFKPEWGVDSYLWKMAGFSFAAFMVGWLYDGLLLALSPEPLMLDGRITQ